MPSKSPREKEAEELMAAYLISVITAADAADDSDSSSGSSSSSSSSSSTSGSSDESMSDAPDFDISDGLLLCLQELFSERYLEARRTIPKSKIILHMLLTSYHSEFPDIFRSYMRISPACFDALVAAIESHLVFNSDSNNGQLPIPEQLAITLFRLGHFGNAASILKVSLWAGVSVGAVAIITRRVLTAICDSRFRRMTVSWPSDEAREEAKQWVEDHSCPAWRDGWCMVDGTLVPLFQRPKHFGNAFYDRKSNYSLNTQLISTPNLRIIDYGVGLPGSQHDATAWKQTRIPKEHTTLLANNEFVWGDSAYPVRSWCQAPYKEPERSALPMNGTHNYYVSNIRIRSEHCVGFLKGRWSSLRGLRVAINSEEALKFATLWIIACIHLHNFAMMHESEIPIESNSFYIEGRQLMAEEGQGQDEEDTQADLLSNEEAGYDENERLALIDGKIKREALKEALEEHIRVNREL